MEEIEERQGDVVILEEWATIDKWWSDEPIIHEYRVVVWNNRTFTFRQISPEKIWRIFRGGIV